MLHLKSSPPFQNLHVDPNCLLDVKPTSERWLILLQSLPFLLSHCHMTVTRGHVTILVFQPHPSAHIHEQNHYVLKHFIFLCFSYRETFLFFRFLERFIFSKKYIHLGSYPSEANLRNIGALFKIKVFLFLQNQ